MSQPVALITGAGSGIGRATAVDLALRGWRLVLIGRTESRLDETQALIADAIDEPVDFIATPVDLTEDDMPATLIDGVAEFWGRLDALVNNAGLAETAPLHESTDDLIDRTFRINAFAPLKLIAASWPLFERTKRDHPNSRPCIVNVSSMATVDPFPGLGVYAASKSALESLARSVRNERGDLDLRAFNIAPGAVETAMLRASFGEDVVPKDRALDPHAVAAEIIACIEGTHDARDGETILVPSP